MTGIPEKPFKVMRNFGISQDFESVGFEILQKLLLSFLEIMKFLGTNLMLFIEGVWTFSRTAQYQLIFCSSVTILQFQSHGKLANNTL